MTDSSDNIEMVREDGLPGDEAKSRIAGGPQGEQAGRQRGDADECLPGEFLSTGGHGGFGVLSFAVSPQCPVKLAR